MDKKTEKIRYFNKIVTEGMQKVGHIPDFIQEDPEMIKMLIANDVAVLFFLPPHLQNEKNFSYAQENKNVLVVNNETNRKIPTKMLEEMLDENSSLLGYSFIKSEFPQFREFDNHARRKLALSFLIEGRSLPQYLSDYKESYEKKSINDLKDIRSSLIMEQKLSKIIKQVQPDENNSFDLFSNKNNFLDGIKI